MEIKQIQDAYNELKEAEYKLKELEDLITSINKDLNAIYLMIKETKLW